MLKKLLPIFMAACVALTLPFAPSMRAAQAHEPRDIEDYNLVVGFLNEPAFEGMLNGVYLSVTKVAEHEHGDSGDHAATHASSGHSDSSSDSHAAMDHAPIESEAPISVNFTTKVDDDGDVDVQIATEGWLWTPDNVDSEHVPGEGHAHIYVDGVKIDRVYGPSYHLEGLEPGERHVRITLNANSHNELTYDGKVLEATAMVTIPETDGNLMAMAMEDAETASSHGEHTLAGVVGLESTLQVEVTHVPSGATRLMSLYPILDEAGKYKADFIPTASGQYSFHFFGTIEGMLIDERFESGAGRFDDVQPATAIQFPESAASTRELESAIRGALESAQQAQDITRSLEATTSSAQSSASTATTLAIAGIAVGAVGIVVGGIGAVAAFRRKA